MLTRTSSARMATIALGCALLSAMFAIALAAPVKIVAFGDSATSGWLVAHDEAYPAQLQRMLRAKGYDAVVKNAGLAGDTTRHALKRFDLAIDPDTDIVLLELGTNDLRLHVARATMEKNIAMLVESLKNRRIGVLLIGLGSLDLSAVAKARGVAYAQWRLPPGKYRARDGAHFSAEGYRIVLERMLPQIEHLIRARVSGQ